MNTTDIIALVALCISVPTFIISLGQIIYYFLKKNLKISIVGSETQLLYNNCETKVFHLQIDNMYKESLSITKITINDNNALIVNKKELCEFSTINLLSYQSVTLKVDGIYSNLNDKIEIKCYTTRRRSPFRKNYKSFIYWSNKYYNISSKDRQKIKKLKNNKKEA